MQAIQWVISTCMAMSWLFYGIFIEISGWWPPFNYLAGPFLWVSDRFIDLAANFTSFMAWVWWAQDWISKILSWDTILSLIQPYLDWVIYAYNWVINAYNFVKGWIEDWWLATKTTVQGWIDVATQGFATLRTEWDNFWKVTFPKLVDTFSLEDWWTGKLFAVDGLIGSKLAEWFPFYNDLAGLWEDIKLFFTDPLDWVYKKLDEFFERYW